MNIVPPSKDSRKDELTDWMQWVCAREPTCLRQYIESLVVRGVADGLVVLDAETGLARARDVEVPQRADGESSEAFLARLAAWHRRHDAEPLRAADESDTDYARRYLDWAALRDAERERWLDRTRRLEDLEFALHGGFAQSTALRALDVELIEYAPAWDIMIAMDLARHLAVVADGWGVSDAIMRRVNDLVQHVASERTQTSAGRWQHALAGLLGVGAHLPRSPQMKPSEQLDDFLRLLTASTYDMPRRFASPTVEQRRLAERFLRTVRVNTLKLEVQPKRKGGGSSLSPWGAAREFARCFGLVDFPAREHDVKRGRARKRNAGSPNSRARKRLKNRRIRN